MSIKLCNICNKLKKKKLEISPKRFKNSPFLLVHNYPFDIATT